MGSYKCECGKDFSSAQQFNGHKSHCKVHLEAVGKLDGYADRQARASATGRSAYEAQHKAKKQQALLDWIAEEHKCERCGQVMTEKFGTGRFCSRTCANTRDLSEETKEKISQSIRAVDCVDFTRVGNHTGKGRVAWSKNKHQACVLEYELNPKKCKICGNILSYEHRNRSTCGNPSCRHEVSVRAGKNSAKVIGKRSKNEIAFCTMCENYFGLEHVLHNEPMFNGWDADIILLDYKLAILWNGPWHYRKITESHSLEQVQTRDRIKVDEINNCGYTPYIIKDLSKANDKKAQEEFDRLLKYLAINY